MNIHAFSPPEVLKLLITSETGLPQGEVDKRGAQPLAEVGHAYPRYAAPIPQVPADDAPEEAEAGEE